MKELSILIPTYNWDVTDFITELHKQITPLNIPFEIVCFDDSSFFEQKNDVNKLSNVFFSVLEENVGRSKIRNLLAEKARYNWMLFLDGDSMPEKPDFIKNYLDTNLDPYTVYCGGRSYSNSKPEEKYLLHWNYGTQRETLGNKEKGFQSNNFLIYKSCFKAILFDDSIVGYGHEDTLFGVQLVKNNYTIQKINAPLRHVGLDANNAFIKKTKTASKNLRILFSRGLITSKDSKLIEFDRNLKFKKYILILVALFQPLLLLLLKRTKNIKILDLLKLVWFNN